MYLFERELVVHQCQPPELQPAVTVLQRAQLCPHASQFCSLGIAVTAWNALHHGSSKAPWTFYMKETLM